MKRILLVLTVGLLIVAMSAGIVHAEQAVGTAGGFGGTASVSGASQGEVACGIATPGVPPGAVFTTGHFTVTPSGNETLVCHARLPDGPPKKIIVNDLPCGIINTVTDKSHTVITPSGRVTLTCHANPSNG